MYYVKHVLQIKLFFSCSCVDYACAEICEELPCCLELPKKTISVMIFEDWESKNLSW